MKLLKQIKIVLKQIQFLFIENIKIVIGMLITLILNYIILYIDIFDMDFLNMKYIEDLEKELTELKQNLKPESKMETVADKNPDFNYYWVGGILLVISGIIIFNFFNNGGDAECLSSNMLNKLPTEETEGVARFLRTPTPPSPPQGASRYTNAMSPVYEKGIKILHDL